MLDTLLGIDHTSVSVTEFKVVESNLREIRPFIDRWHYSHGNIPSIRHCFKLMHEGDCIGVIAYGLMPMMGAWKAYEKFGVTKETDILDLRRLCCIDDTPKNTESYFIGKTIKWLRKNTDYKCIVSYADPFHGHGGIIYKATNFEHLGMSSPGKVILWGDKTYHDKTIRDYNRAHYKKTGERIPAAIATRLKQALESGDAKLVDTPGKHIYFYPLTKECRKLTLKLVTSKVSL